MTVCIAALYDNRRGAVLASDRMVTAAIPMGYEFEHQDISKLMTMDGETGSILALSAGDVLVGTEILELAKRQILEVDRAITASEVTEIVRRTYQVVRLQRIAQTELEPRGLDLESYQRLQQALAPQIVQMADQALKQGDANVEIIIAGPDSQGYTLHAIVNPGLTHDHTPIGYCAIGSGAPHAMYSMIEAEYSRSLKRSEVKELVERAKKRSEVAPGVGSGTQIRVIPRGEDNETVQ